MRLIAGIKEAGVYAGLAFSEKDDNFLYMAQALITPSGDSLLHRHKLRPSGGERDIFTDGDIGGLQVVDSQYGRIGMLECGE
jgi:predicted amidohydrolase